MKRYKLSFLMVFPFALTVLAGCEETSKPTNEKHEHQYAQTWSNDEINHWHAATCEHTDLKIDVQAHAFNNEGICSTCGFVNPSMQSKYKVDEDTWYKVLKGEGPFEIINNGTINVESIYQDDARAYSLIFDNNKAKICDAINTYAEYSDGKYYLYQPSNVEPNMYVKTETKYSYFMEFYEITDILRSLLYTSFRYNDKTHTYDALIKVHTYNRSFDEVSLEFLNGKIMRVVCYANQRNFCLKITFDYKNVSIELPPCVVDHGTIEFWSCFGKAYTSFLDEQCQNIADNLVMHVEHTSQGSYDKMKYSMMCSIPDLSYPNVGTDNIGNVFEYNMNDIINPLDTYLTDDIANDYNKDLMNLSTDIDQEGDKHVLALPFLESKEFLVYNVAFVEYCKLQNPVLGTIPDTWQKWEEYGPLYRTIYDDLIDKKYCIYGRVAVNGVISDIVAKTKENIKDENGYIDSDGRRELVDFTYIAKKDTKLMVWDQQDNAFITLIKQWGADYVEIPESEYQYDDLYRKTHIRFTSEENKSKVIDCLKFFNKLNKKNIFGVPKNSFAEYDINANVAMFAVCSGVQSAYLSSCYSKIGVKPIPHYDDGITVNKYLVSGGTSLFVTDRGNLETSFNFARALSSGSNQANMCLQTGYLPTTKSACESNEYKSFMNETNPESIQALADSKNISYADAEKEVFSNKARTMKREAATINSNFYNNEVSRWKVINSDSFCSSDIIRGAIRYVLKDIFNASGLVDEDKIYIEELNKIENDPNLLMRRQNIIFDH